MKLLIIGGTRFLGRHLLSAALARNHEVTLFNRGQHQSAVPEGVENIQGDRNHDLAKLTGRHWDAVIDTCGTLPQPVKASAQLLSSSVDRYVFVSSMSVYADLSAPGVAEDGILKTLTSEQLAEANSMDPASPGGYGPLYGGLKAMSEASVIQAMRERALIVRPGLIVGPFDYTDRFTYWVMRVARGGEVLAPGRPARPVQFIDARDLAEWIVALTERGRAGIYNANGAAGSITMENVLSVSRAVTGTDSSFTWVSEPFLFQENVLAWSDMPLWLPEENAPQLKGFMLISTAKATSEGLKIRSLHESIKDIYEWRQAEVPDEPLVAGITIEKENALLKKWQETS